MTFFNKKEKDHYQKEYNDLTLAGQKIDSIVFEECSFKGCDFSEAVFRKCTFIECHFFKCNLSITKTSYSIFNDVIFKDCKAIGIDWTQADWPNITSFSPLKFYKCMINDSTFFGLNLNEMVIEECKAHDVDFREGSFCNSNFTLTDFSKSQFNQTNLAGTDFTEAVNYEIDINYNKINKAKFSRYEAISLLECLDIELID